MSTEIKLLSATYAPAASGPGAVYLTFTDSDGFFTVHGSVDPSAIVIGHPVPKNTVFGIVLIADEHLHIKGRGFAAVSATTLI